MPKTEPKTTQSNNEIKAETAVDETQNISQNQAASTIDLKKITLEENGTNMKKSKVLLIVICVIAAAAGTATGYGAYKLRGGDTGPSTGPKGSNLQQVAGDVIKTDDVFGVQDESTFKDSAQGYLTEGGVDGEGSHSLLRPGGESQTVYLTSSITDLDKFIGMEIKVWGETFKGQKAGWLMDVGRVEVVETKGESPIEE